MTAKSTLNPGVEYVERDRKRICPNCERVLERWHEPSDAYDHSRGWKPFEPRAEFLGKYLIWASRWAGLLVSGFALFEVLGGKDPSSGLFALMHEYGLSAFDIGVLVLSTWLFWCWAIAGCARAVKQWRRKPQPGADS